MNKTKRNTPQHGHSVGRTADGKRIVSPTYKTWRSMKARCDYPTVNGYERYGGRGISYDIRWGIFQNFLDDMGERPEGKTLDRVDSDKHYYKENCRWVTPAEQQATRKDRPSKETVAAIKAQLVGGLLNQTEIAAQYGVTQATISRIKSGQHRKNG